MNTELVRYTLRKKAMTQKDLARAVGCTPAAISRYLNGFREPSRKIVEKIAEALGVEISEVEDTGTCGWEHFYDNGRGAYRTACGEVYRPAGGESWQVFCGAGESAGFVYCPFCGREIEEVSE